MLTVVSCSRRRGPNFRRRRIEMHHLRSVVVDDEILAKEGMGGRLTHPKLLEELWEKGRCDVRLVHFGRAS